MISEKIEVAAVLVTYNRVALLKRAIDSLLKQSVELKYIVIVNNNSTDGTRDYLDNNENDKNMCYIKIDLSHGFFYKDGTGYDVDFINKQPMRLFVMVLVLLLLLRLVLRHLVTWKRYNSTQLQLFHQVSF